MALIDFQPTEAYTCCGCRCRLLISPCPLCEALDRFPLRGGLTADRYASRMARRTRHVTLEAYRAAGRQ